MLACNKIANIRRRVNRAREFPTNTCGASRHVHRIADGIMRGNYCGMVSSNLSREEREWIAGSLYSVIESLWKLRAKGSR